MIKIILTKSSDEDFISLTGCLDDELHKIYGDLQNFYNRHNIIELNENVIVVYDDKIPAGCGCFKKFNEETIEIKRMFVKKDYRGRGISKIILKGLEKRAFEQGFKKAVLETGIKQAEAIGLYKKSGYQRIENYSQYEGIETSICMVKDLLF
jgi:putative acetyltransferase